MIKIPHLYRVEAGPLGPAKRQPPPDPSATVVERWRAVDGKPHLEQNDRGQFRTKDFTNESNNPYPSVPDKNTIEPMKPYFDLAVDAQLIADGEEEAEDPWNRVASAIRAELPNVLNLGVLVPEFQRIALIEAADGVSKYWSAPMLYNIDDRFQAINFGLDIAKAAYLRLVSEERMGKHAAPDLSPAGTYISTGGALHFHRARANGTVTGLQLLMRENEKRVEALQNLTREKALDCWRKYAAIVDFGHRMQHCDFTSN